MIFEEIPSSVFSFGLLGIFKSLRQVNFVLFNSSIPYIYITIMQETSTKNPKILGSTSEEIDRISSLPDDILHHILSSFYIFDAFQLSRLSKRWEYILTTMPYLHFDIPSFYFERIQRPFDKEMVENFKDFINWVLISQSSSKIVRFLLCCGGIFDKVAILRWIRAITKRNVQQLVLSFCLDEPFELPYCLVTCESLQVLKLNLVRKVLKLPHLLGFRRLKFLHLKEVELSGEHGCLFSNCHLLEHLILEDCSLGATTLLHIALTSLIYVTLKCEAVCYSNCEIKISCPHLKFLKYKGSMPKDLIIENLFSIEAVHVFFDESPDETGVLVHNMIKEVSSASSLKLCNVIIWGLYEATHSLRLSPVSFCKLKYLSLYVNVDEYFVQTMIPLLKSSPNIEVLKLYENELWNENEDWSGLIYDTDESIVCLESHLKSLQLSNFLNEENEMELLRFFLKKARVLEKLTIVWASNADKSEEVLEEVLKFPRYSSHVALTLLDTKPLGSKPRSRSWNDTEY